MFKPPSHQLLSLQGLQQSHVDNVGRKRSLLSWQKALIQGLLITSPLWGLIRPAIAAPTPPGTIDNTATGSFTDTSTGNTVNIFSNTVTVTVVEVAGITIVPQTPIEATPAQAGTNAGTYQSIAGIHTGDLVYFDFVLTNVGNDPTSFFIPSSPANVTGGTFNATNAPIQIIAVDPDGTGTGYSSITNLNGSNGPVNVTTAGTTTTTTLLGATNGYIPPDGTVTVRVPIRITETTVGNTITVVLGQTPTVGDQNITYVAGTNDVYTADLADTTTNPYTSPATTPETPGAPAGTPTGEKEASAQSTVALADPNVDFGDAPDTTTGTGANDYQTTIGDVLSTSDDGALHSINTNLKLGTNAPDADNGTLQNANADADDTSLGTDDEDGVTLPNIFTNTSSYTATVNLTNTIGSGAYLVAWIDFDRDGVFAPSEGVVYDSDSNAGNGITPVATGTTNTNVSLTWTSLSGLSAGTTYARFRLSDSASLTASTPTGLVGNGEVEDYAITIASSVATNPDLLLVKRITRLIPGDGGADIPYTNYVDDGVLGTADPDGNGIFGDDDNDSGWPGYEGTTRTNTYTLGETTVEASPRDTIEYTIYFLNTGDGAASNVRICDLLDKSLEYVTNTYNGTTTPLGIQLTTGSSPVVTEFLTGINDSDSGEFVAAGTAPANCIDPDTNTQATDGTDGMNGNINGAITVDITSVPAATANDSYGFVRFRAKVK
ncbi:MAG: beta strand repeat-containing protein [Prochlorotrichaceae cyanobacterium]